jgi:hypothetical protein
MLRVYAQLAAASAPIIEASSVGRRRPTVRRYRGRIICTMLKCPPHGAAPRAVAAARVLRSRRPIKNISSHIYRACAAIGSTP